MKLQERSGNHNISLNFQSAQEWLDNDGFIYLFIYVILDQFILQDKYFLSAQPLQASSGVDTVSLSLVMENP